MEVVSILTLATYNVAVIFLFINWKKIQPTTINIHTDISFSIIVAIKNEEHNILALLESLMKQNIQNFSFEVILVNDNSSDNSKQIVNNFIATHANLILLNNNGVGKKAAIKTGIDYANGEIIICTDGDCEVGPNWLMSYANFFNSKDAKLVFGPMAFKKRIGNNKYSLLSKLWYDFQQIEYASLIGSGAASWQAQMPNMCNGGNIAFTKKVFAEVKGYEGNQHLNSGDDEFLMHKVYSRYPKDVYFNKSKHAIVRTDYCETVLEFYNQRMRWASKWEHYTDWKVKAVAFFVFWVNICTFFVIGYLFYKILTNQIFGTNPLEIGVFTLLITRWLVEYIFLSDVIAFLNQKIKLSSFISLVFIYPFYVVFFAVTSIKIFQR